MAVDSSGNAIAVWIQADGIFESMWSNRYNAASGCWGQPELIEQSDEGKTSDPQLAADSNDNAIAIWELSVNFNTSPDYLGTNRLD